MRYSFYESVQDSAGNVLNAANVSIYLTGTATPVKIYDSNGNLQSTTPQLQTDSKGYFWFEVDDTDYDNTQRFDIKITKSGYADLLIKKIYIIGASSATSSGDMTKAVYDTDNNGIVDKAETVDDGTNSSTAAEVSDAVAKKHSQQHSITSTTDHISTATPNRILKADANGLPTSATNTDAEVASAVAKANSALQNVVEDTTPQLGGALDAQAHIIYFTLQTYTGVVGTTNIDWTKGNKAKFTFGAGNETLTFTDPAGSCGLTLILDQSTSPLWAAQTAYAVGNFINPTTANGYQYKCTVNGTSGLTEPTFPTTNGATVDDDVGATTWVASTDYALDDLVVPTTANGYYYKCTTAGTSDSTEPTWTTTEGSTVTDGTAVWTCYKIATWECSGKTLTYPANIKWIGKVVPTLSTEANAIDAISFIYDGTNYIAQAGLNAG